MLADQMCGAPAASHRDPADSSPATQGPDHASPARGAAQAGTDSAVPWRKSGRGNHRPPAPLPEWQQAWVSGANSTPRTNETGPNPWSRSQCATWPVRMHPRIGATCGGDGMRPRFQPSQRRLDRGLNRRLTLGLPLPAVEWPAVIVNFQRKSWHASGYRSAARLAIADGISPYTWPGSVPILGGMTKGQSVGLVI